MRIPQLHWSDDSGAHHPAPVAVVEDVRGRTLEALLERDTEAAARVMMLLADGVAAMHACEGTTFGKVAPVDGGGTSRGRSCEQVVHDSALGNLDEAAHRDPRRVDGLDAARLGLYSLAMRLSLVAGPLRLLDGGFPGRQAMVQIAEHNLRCVLEILNTAHGAERPNPG